MDDLDVVAVWAAGRGLSAAVRPLTVLAACRTGLTGAELTTLPVGQRNLLLLEARRRTFGDRLDAEAECPACGARLELSLTVGDLLRDAGNGSAQGKLTIGGFTMSFRALTSADLAAAASTGDPRAAVAVLLDRCVLDATGADGPVAAAALPPEVVDAIDDALAGLDPFGHLRIAVGCAACGEPFEVDLEPGALYWTELVDRARQLMTEVHRLASAYGWSEHDILTMDPVRRAGYLDLVG
jgi:hypothetical protein